MLTGLLYFLFNEGNYLLRSNWLNIFFEYREMSNAAPAAPFFSH